MKDKVLQWIDNIFYITSITLTDCPLFSGGTILTDRNGEKMLVHFDIQYECIKYEFI